MFESNAVLILPTLPSIISDGAIISQPALAWTRACCSKTSKVLSLSILSFITKPSCPWSVKGSNATSHTIPIFGKSFLILLIDLHTKLFSSTAKLPSEFLRSLSICGKIAIAGILNLTAFSTSLKSLSIEYLLTPGIELIGSSTLFPSHTNRGKIKSLTLSVFSATKRRENSFILLRLSLVLGNLPCMLFIFYSIGDFASLDKLVTISSNLKVFVSEDPILLTDTVLS